MKRTLLLITTLVFIFSLALTGQQQTSDGGFVIGGFSESYTHGGYDFLVYKLDSSGAKQWRKNYGGGGHDIYSRVIQTSDGGYAVIGYSATYTHGSDDFLFYKLDAVGAKQWRKNLGGLGSDQGFDIVQTVDQGYFVSGHTTSYTNGGYDLLVYKLNASGAKQWRKNYGGVNSESGGNIAATSDGGFVLCGRTKTYSNGSFDFLVYKLDAAGQKQWRKNYGGEKSDTATVIRQTIDGGYMVGGYSTSFSEWSDFLVYKVNAAGAKQWRKNYGGEDIDLLYDFRQTSDGGYLLMGGSNSYNHSGNDYDFLLYRIDASGNELWRKNYGGDHGDHGWMCIPASDGNYLLLGDTGSYIHGTPGDDSDLLLYKVTAAGAKLWRKNYGGSEPDYAFGK